MKKAPEVGAADAPLQDELFKSTINRDGESARKKEVEEDFSEFFFFAGLSTNFFYYFLFRPISPAWEFGRVHFVFLFFHFFLFGFFLLSSNFTCFFYSILKI